MVKAMTLDRTDQRSRRRRARITQSELAARLGISMSKVSEYETGKRPLPWELTAEDYERALAELCRERKSA